MALVAEYAKRVIVLSQGKVIMDGLTAEVFRHPEVLKTTFIELPQIVQLAHAVGIYKEMPVLTVRDMYNAYFLFLSLSTIKLFRFLNRYRLNDELLFSCVYFNKVFRKAQSRKAFLKILFKFLFNISFLFHFIIRPLKPTA
jgi:hypothetical protein